jgi:hypothetical protein
MKKTIITAIFTIFAFVFFGVGVTALCTRASAAEVVQTEAPEAESLAESEIPPSTPIESEEETPENTVDAPIVTDGETKDEKTSLKSIIDAVTNSSLWISVGAYLLAAIATISVVVKNINAVKSLLGSKADKEVIKSAIKDGTAEIRETFDAEYKKINAELEAHREKEKQMWAILTIFMTHAKIPAAAKAEIMNCVTGLKDMTGDIAEIVEEAEKAICAAEEEAKLNAAPTPALDEIISTAAGVMELG